MTRVWKIRVIGVVSMPEGNRRVPAPRGDYEMREAEGESYRLTRENGPTFDLTLMEVATYTKDDRLRILQGVWP